MTYVDLAPAPIAFVAVSEAVDDERDLVARAQARDASAFEQLYRTHMQRVYAVCLRMTGSVVTAEDLTQRAFVAAWNHLPRFRGDSAFSSWLHRVAVNTVLADLRAEQRRNQRVFTTENPAAFETAPPASPIGTRLDLEQEIAALPPQARAVFVLHDVEGWQHDEIAAQLGVAVGTTKAQLHRARKLLQEALR
ncbi:MAG: RNA polymerase sigma factor [Opitutaceae bacterium]|nr:RNA polymerase sigma factor [Opitutaceae bacterium]